MNKIRITMNESKTFVKTCPKVQTCFFVNKFHRQGFVILTSFTIDSIANPKYHISSFIYIHLF